MLLFLLQILFMFVNCDNVTVNQQLILFKEKTNGHIGTLTLSSGAPVFPEDVLAINKNLLNNDFFLDTELHFVSERIPLRVVHPKAAGAHGYFEVTNDITDICKADLFSEVGKRTKVTARLSLTYTEYGGADTSRDNRGISVKFYTEEGNLDLVALATRMFVVKDPIKIIQYIRAFKRNPATNIYNENSRWDYLTRNQESIFAFFSIFSDMGISDGYRHMPGYVIHPYQVYNKDGDVSFVKINFHPALGRKNLTTLEAANIQRVDLDYAMKDVYNAILNGNYPTWKVTMNVMTADEVRNADFDVFDITKVWPKNIREIEVGKIVLNEIPENFFAEIEQLAMSPANLVPGILGGVDSMFISRRLYYRDAHVHRLGSNFNNIRVNRPLAANTYLRDGNPPVGSNGKGAPNYYPNSFNGPEVRDLVKPELWNPCVDPEVNNLDQVEEFVNEMSEGERTRLAENIVLSLSRAEKFLQRKSLKMLKNVHLGLGQLVEKFLYAAQQ